MPRRAAGLDRWGFPIPGWVATPSRRSKAPKPQANRTRAGFTVNAKMLPKLRQLQRDRRPGQTFTLCQIASHCGVSPAVVLDIERSALRKLRTRLRPDLCRQLHDSLST